MLRDACRKVSASEAFPFLHALVFRIPFWTSSLARRLPDIISALLLVLQYYHSSLFGDQGFPNLIQFGAGLPRMSVCVTGDKDGYNSGS